MDEAGDHVGARAHIAAVLREAGVDLDAGSIAPDATRGRRTLAVLGRAGSGKTHLLSSLVRALTAVGVEPIGVDDDRRARGRRTLAVLAPTNKAASVLRARGVPATTIHRILYTPIYHPDYERIADWLAGKADRPAIERVTDAALDRAVASFRVHKSLPGALASAGLRGSDFITGWKRRDDPLDIGLIDEASMLNERQFADLEELFGVLVIFGDPAQLAPVGGSGEMVFDGLPAHSRIVLGRSRRQAHDSPILDLADALGDGDLDFDGFNRLVRTVAARDGRVVIAERADADLMARAPMLVWRNSTRVRLIHGFRAAYGVPDDRLVPGEPLICDGIELPAQHRRKRVDLEARGLIKGTQAIYLGPGRRVGFSKIHVVGAEEAEVTVATIIRLELPEREEPLILTAARMGVSFVHGAAVTVHKAQGSQWPIVQVFAPDILAASRSGRIDAGTELWRRLAYVAVTRAEERLVWVTRAMLARPRGPLGTADLMPQVDHD